MTFMHLPLPPSYPEFVSVSDNTGLHQQLSALVGPGTENRGRPNQQETNQNEEPKCELFPMFMPQRSKAQNSKNVNKSMF